MLMVAMLSTILVLTMCELVMYYVLNMEMSTHKVANGVQTFAQTPQW